MSIVSWRDWTVYSIALKQDYVTLRDVREATGYKGKKASNFLKGMVGKGLLIKNPNGTHRVRRLK